MKAKRVAKEGLEVAFALLKLTSAAADAFPPLKSAAGGALHIAEMVSKFNSSKQEWVNLADHIVADLGCVIESLPESKEPREDLRRNIESLADALVRIQKEISSLQHKSGLSRVWNFVKEPDKIAGMRKELDNAISLFHLKAALTTGLDVAMLLDGSNFQQLLEGVNRKLGETIVSTINLSAIPYAEGASWDPNPSNACLPDTRVELLAEIMSWVESSNREETPKVLWLSSVAGGGKTAVANTFAKICHEKGLLGASFFFNRNTAGRNDPTKLFSTIARGLASYSREIAAHINLAIEADQTVATGPIFRQFQELILKPSLRYSGSKPIVVLIDGADEGCNTELLQILRDEFPRLPNVFRILVTSRPQPEIVAFLSNEGHIRRVNINILGRSNLDDIALYAKHQLHEVSRQRSLASDWPGAELTLQFTARAGGLFIWVSVVSRYLCRVSYPEKKLVSLLSRTSKQKMTAEAQMMDVTYAAILESCDWEDDDFVEGYGLIMGAITAAKTPLSISALESLHRHNRVEVEEILRPLGSLILSDLTDTTQPVQLLHLSLQEFLTSPPQHSLTKVYLGNREHSQRLAHLCLAIINDYLPLDIPGAGFLQEGTPESKVDGIPDMNNVGIPEVLWYACRFWLDHLIGIEDPEQETLDQLHKFLSTQLVSWLEIVAGKGQFLKLECLLEWLQKMMPNHCELLELMAGNSIGEVFTDLSDRLQYMDRREDALNAIEYVVVLHRRHSDLPAFIPDLANSLHRLSINLSKLGRREDALVATEEALALRRQLAADCPAAFNPDLANSLSNLSADLSELGRPEDALVAIEEAVALRRQLAADRPAAFNPDLAASLNNLSADLSHLGRPEDALVAIEEAVALYRQLAADRPAAFNPDLARSLNNLSRNLSEIGRPEDALVAIEEAAALGRQLAADRPAAFNPDLAISLNNLSKNLSEIGRPEDALVAIEEAVALWRQLAADRPAAFNPDLANSLSNLSADLSELGRPEDALVAIEEAVALRRQLAADRPAAFNPDLAISLNNLSKYLSDLGRPEDALVASEEAVALRRQLAADRPAAFIPVLANSLNSLSKYLSELDRPEDALVAIEEAVALRRQLAADRPATFNPDLARSLNNLSKNLSEIGRPEDALVAIEEAAALGRQLAADRPAAFNPDLAISLNNLSKNLSEIGRPEDALVAIEEAVALWRQLAADRPAAFNPDLANSLSNLSADFSELGRPEDALVASEEAVALRRQLAAERPPLYRDKLARSLYSLSKCLYDLGREAEALEAEDEAERLDAQ